MASPDDRQPLLLSVDFEDWHQLVRRRVGASDWEQPGPALGRQTDVLLDRFDELGVRATFFVLGLAARAHPHLIEQVVERGHEIGCHGDRHQLVHGQTQPEFAADLQAACRTIESLTGRRPAGYRAPAFSITHDCRWAYDVLVDEGFEYDSSQHDSPRIRGRVVPSQTEPHRLELSQGSLWEFPVAVWRSGGRRVPVGGASYWAVLPTGLVLRGLESVGRYGALYLHPYELDPEALRTRLPGHAPWSARVHGRLRAAQRNLARRRAPGVLHAIARRYRLIPYGEAYALLSGRAPAGTEPV
jgi:polysaccharide deacetylase family protein (PEP-CTERM system associated)